MRKDPESELSEFLAQLPSWVENVLWSGPPELTNDRLIWIDYLASGRWDEITCEYESILRRIPARWKEYRKQHKHQSAEFARTWLLPSQGPGRPRQDARVEMAQRLKAAGKTWRQIADEINEKYGKDTTNPEAIRQLVKSRKITNDPEKT